MNEHFYIKLLQLDGVGRKTLFMIRSYIIENSIDFDGLDNKETIKIFRSLRDDNRRIKVPKLDDMKVAEERANDIIKKTSENNINIITIDDKIYPNEFREINTPPIVYYYRGNNKLVHRNKKIAIIGTRYPSKRGSKYAYNISKYLTESNHVIVSGLASGCDTYGHQGCLDNNGNTIAVLPSDLLNIYPKQNTALAEKIIEKEGCLMSEYPVGNKLSEYQFIERDRLQAALSKVVIVIETGLNSGTMHTVKYTKQYNKKLACLEYPKHMSNYKSIQGNKVILKEKGIIRISTLFDLKKVENSYM